MSTRFYPRFVRGNPQLRIFLPDWILVMVKPKKSMPNNIVTFKVDPRMTDWDIKNYLEKIYKVQVAGVSSYIRSGELYAIGDGCGLAKKEDFKIAHVTLPLGHTFDWPDLFPKEKSKEQMTDYERTLKEINKGRTQDPNVQDIPSWFR